MRRQNLRGPALILFALLLLQCLSMSAWAETEGHWVQIGEAGPEVFIPGEVASKELSDSDKESGYTAIYSIDDVQVGLGVWAVAEDHGFEAEYSYSVESYGAENVKEGVVNDLPVLYCEMPDSNSLMMTYPNEKGSVYFVLGTPADSSLYRALISMVFNSLRDANKDALEQDADQARLERIREAIHEGSGSDAKETMDDETLEQTNAALETANAALQAGDYAKAEACYTAAYEETRNPVFLFNLGVLYETPDTGIQDYAKAVEWYEKAAEQGSMLGLTNLAYMYMTAEYNMLDYDKAIQLYSVAAEAGNAGAMYSLGCLYFFDEYGMVDLEKCVEWFTKAAELGDISAADKLIDLYSSPDFGMQDQDMADRWLAKYNELQEAEDGEGPEDEAEETVAPEESAQTSDNGITYLGEGEKVVDVLVSIGDEELLYEIRTDQTYLLKALEEVGLVEAEVVPWGYNVTTVAGVTADYDADGSYWGIVCYDEASSDWVALDTSIAYTEIPEGDEYYPAYGFIYTK